MEDQAIYKSIAQELYDVTPDLDKKTHYIFLKEDNGHHTTQWNGEYFGRETSFSIPSEKKQCIDELFIELYSKTLQFNLANWNVAHFVLFENGKRFDINYEHSEELKQHSTPFWKYCQKFKESTSKPNKKANIFTKLFKRKSK